MTVAEMLERMSSLELSRWRRYFAWKDEQADKARRDAEREGRRRGKH